MRRRLFRTPMYDVALDHTWSGSAEVRFAAPELGFLEDARPLGGRWSTIAWTKPYPEQLVLEERVPA